jgi:prephenate dehydrogenase
MSQYEHSEMMAAVETLTHATAYLRMQQSDHMTLEERKANIRARSILIRKMFRLGFGYAFDLLKEIVTR